MLGYCRYDIVIFNEVRSRAGGLSVTQRDGDQQSVDACCSSSVLSQISVSLMNVFEEQFQTLHFFPSPLF